MEKILAKKIIEDKKNGLSDKEIGEKYRINLKFIERAITKETGVNISYPSNVRKINEFNPKNFNLENTSVWSFKSRGNWATHDGNYRGNWSPYIPRNIILRYSKENDIVLDYFCGAGTTAIECKLLNRKFIGIDVNPKAIELARNNVDFDGFNNSIFNVDIKLNVGDARNLSFINDESIDLICAHPPYSNIINYTHNNPNDLSNFKDIEFLSEIEKVARESYRVLKDNGYCSILIGDMRKNKNVIPLGFWTIEKYLKTGFKIKELIIKRQHNCKTTGFWYKNSIKYNFLLLAHEYLLVFQKITTRNISEQYLNQYTNDLVDIKIDNNIQLESKTVWVFDNKNWVDNTISNLVKRYSHGDYLIYKNDKKIKNKYDLIVIINYKNFFDQFNLLKNNLKEGVILAFICEDFRIKNNLIFPTAIAVEKEFSKNKEFGIKEIIIVSIENNKLSENLKNIDIRHKYILIYKRS